MAQFSQPIDLGGCHVTLLDAGALKLDGGAMFGLIPKALWQRGCLADEDNRIQLACNSLLVTWPDTPQPRLIVETGPGNKYATKEQRIFALDPARWLGPTLAQRGIDPATITDVVLTHLHFDHAGGLTQRVGEQLVPTFPNATVHVQQQEYDDAHSNHSVMTATYRAENLALAAQRWRLLVGDAEILPGVRVVATPGHTRGHQSVIISGQRRKLVFAGDFLPTRHHVGPPYNMAYDLLPLDNRETKQRMLAWIAAEDALLVLDHEVDTPVVTAQPAGEWFALTPYVPQAP